MANWHIMDAAKTTADAAKTIQVKSGAIDITPELADLFKDSYVSAAAAATDMIVELPQPVAAILWLENPELVNELNVYMIDKNMAAMLAIQFAYRCGAFTPEKYIEQIVQFIGVVPDEYIGPRICEIVRTIPEFNFSLLPDEFWLRHCDLADADGTTLLIYDCKNNFTEDNRSIAQELIEAGCDVSCVNKYGETALHWAFDGPHFRRDDSISRHRYIPYRSDIGIIDAILRKCKTSEYLNQIRQCDGNTALISACRHREPKIIKMILASAPDGRGGIPHHMDSEGRTALWYISHRAVYEPLHIAAEMSAIHALLIAALNE
jgi:hypothetical protein